jgi:lantibiotic modifying enzyme
LRKYVQTYRDVIATVRYAELDELQPPPFASLGHGGAGTAYALWRLDELARARRWLAASLGDRRRFAFDSEEDVMQRTSYLHGRGGLYWMRVLVAGPAQRGQAIAAYVRCAKAATAPIEFIDGLGGHLTATRLLLARFADPRLRKLAVMLAALLGDRLAARVREPWLPIDASGFAHYWPGALHALLAWMMSSGQPVPSWLTDAMRALLAVWTPDIARSPRLAASWCNGAAGTLLLWCKAYQAIGDPAFLHAARQAADRAMTAPYAGADLCCGLGGIAYALLELSQVDPAGGWREQAQAVALRAIEAPVMRWPNGLFRGHPGLVCLALDLLADQPVGFPAIEA